MAEPFSGFFLAVIVVVLRFIERKLHPNFVMLDANVDGALLRVKPTSALGVGALALVTIIMLSGFNYLLDTATGLSLLNPTEILAASDAVFLIL